MSRLLKPKEFEARSFAATYGLRTGDRFAPTPWHLLITCTTLGVLAALSGLFLPRPIDAPMMVAFMAAACTYVIGWLFHGADYDKGLCAGRFEEKAHVERIRKIRAAKHPRDRDGQFTARRAKEVA